MNAMILAAGLGTRLRPWTLNHPKALVPVGGVPMLERVIGTLVKQGFDRIVVNVHHFSDQVIDFVRSKEFGVEIKVSDETGRLLDTGGGILNARELFDFNHGPVLVHNVDILSDADLHGFMQSHLDSRSDASLLISERESSRKLIFDKEMNLKGWHDISKEIYRPDGFIPTPDYRDYAFSGIHILGERAFEEMSVLASSERFPIMDYYLSGERKCDVKGVVADKLHLIDIGKPSTLAQAEEVLG